MILQSINKSELLLRFSTSLHHQYGILGAEIQTSLFYKTAVLKEHNEGWLYFKNYRWVQLVCECFGSSYHVLTCTCITRHENPHLVPFAVKGGYLSSLFHSFATGFFCICNQVEKKGWLNFLSATLRPLTQDFPLGCIFIPRTFSSPCVSSSDTECFEDM